MRRGWTRRGRCLARGVARGIGRGGLGRGRRRAAEMAGLPPLARAVDGVVALEPVDELLHPCAQFGGRSVHVGGRLWVQRRAEGERHRHPERSPKRTRCRLVISRCPPQTATGMTGTPASAARRTAPVFRSRTLNDALTPASGNTPMISPSRSACTAAAIGCGAGLHVDGDVPHAAHEPADDGLVEHRLLRQEAHAATRREPRDPLDEGELEVAEMRHREHGSTGRGNVARRP